MITAPPSSGARNGHHSGERPPRQPQHRVQFYEAESVLMASLTTYVGEALRSGQAAVVVATEEHRRELDRRLLAHGVDLGDVVAADRYLALDAAATLAQCLLDGRPHQGRFNSVIGRVLDRAANGGRWVRAYGEMVALLAAEGRHADAAQLETLWNQLLARRPFELYCAYPVHQFDGAERAPALEAALALHTHVDPAEGYLDLADGDERWRAIAQLQQQARSLQAEIAHRRRAEEQLQAALAAERVAREEMQTLYRLGQLVGAELDLERLVQAVTDAGTELTGAQFGAFFYNVLDDRGESYTLYTISGAPRAAFEHFPMPRSTAVFGPTFRGEGIVRLDDVRQDPRYGQNPPYQGMPPGHLPVVSYLAVPVVSRSGEVLGGLFFGHKQAGVFSARHEKLVAGLAGQAAAAMDNSRLYRESQDSLRLRDQFLGAIAHDLKTPLAAIKGGAQMLKRQVARGALTPERLTAAADGLDVAATRLGRLVEQLLDVARLQAGRPMELDLQPTDLVALAERLVAEHQRSTDVHQLRVEAALPQLVGRWDAARLERALDNLLSNAVKYSPEGGEVLVRVWQADAATAAFSVQDHGVGIPSADLPRIFDQFHRAANVERRIAGTGIGLASAHQVVTLHGGTIDVASEEGRGTTFTVCVPLAAPRSPRA